jgi:hypothetical protein
MFCLQRQTLLITLKFRQKVGIDAQTSENVQNLDLLQKNAVINIITTTQTP